MVALIPIEDRTVFYTTNIVWPTYINNNNNNNNNNNIEKSDCYKRVYTNRQIGQR